MDRTLEHDAVQTRDAVRLIAGIFADCLAEALERYEPREIKQAASVDTSGLPATLSVEDASRFLGISRSATYEAVRGGILPSLRIGRRIPIPTQRLLLEINNPQRRVGE
jgi:excisionase family DNA binding protein